MQERVRSLGAQFIAGGRLVNVERIFIVLSGAALAIVKFVSICKFMNE